VEDFIVSNMSPVGLCVYCIALRKCTYRQVNITVSMGMEGFCAKQVLRLMKYMRVTIDYGQLVFTGVIIERQLVSGPVPRRLFFCMIHHPLDPEFIGKHAEVITPGCFAHGYGHRAACGQLVE